MQWWCGSDMLIWVNSINTALLYLEVQSTRHLARVCSCCISTALSVR
jgi:hypothetical protein